MTALRVANPVFVALDTPDLPHARETFEACKLDWEERDESIVEMHRTLLRLRTDDPLTGGVVHSAGVRTPRRAPGARRDDG